MLTIRGLYDGKNIIPLESFEMPDSEVEVTITFLEPQTKSTAPTAIKFTEDLIYEPALFFLTTKQAGKLEPEDVYFVGIPKLIVEIVSHSSRRRDTQIKLADYEHFSVEEYWLLDPLKKEYRFYHLEGKYYQPILVENDIFRSIVLVGFEMDLRELMFDLE